MSTGQNRGGIPWVLVLLLGFIFVVILVLGPDLSTHLTGRATGSWDPFSPILNGLAGIGKALQDQFRTILR